MNGYYSFWSPSFFTWQTEDAKIHLVEYDIVGCSPLAHCHEGLLAKTAVYANTMARHTGIERALQAPDAALGLPAVAARLVRVAADRNLAGAGAGNKLLDDGVLQEVLELHHLGAVVAPGALMRRAHGRGLKHLALHEPRQPRHRATVTRADFGGSDLQGAGRHELVGGNAGGGRDTAVADADGRGAALRAAIAARDHPGERDTKYAQYQKPRPTGGDPGVTHTFRIRPKRGSHELVGLVRQVHHDGRQVMLGHALPALIDDLRMVVAVDLADLIDVLVRSFGTATPPLPHHLPPPGLAVELLLLVLFASGHFSPTVACQTTKNSFFKVQKLGCIYSVTYSTAQNKPWLSRLIGKNG